MDFRGTDKMDDLASETPEDVAVLYSWANLHGAKYRDFSASRREYRAQLRHRAAEQVRQQALLAQAEAEAAAAAADAAARQATEAANKPQPEESDSSVQRSLREAEEAARTAAAERVEAARRAEAAAVAEAAARREEREIAEAHASAQRQAARYADSEMRRRVAAGGKTHFEEVPGQVTDPYTMNSHAHPPASPVLLSQTPMEPAPLMQTPDRPPLEPVTSADAREKDHHFAPVSPSMQAHRRAVEGQPSAARRPQGYRPDDASGVRQIYRGPEYDAPVIEYTSGEPARSSPQAEGDRTTSVPTRTQRPNPVTNAASPRFSGGSASPEAQSVIVGQRRTDASPPPVIRSLHGPSAGSFSVDEQPGGPQNADDRLDTLNANQDSARETANPAIGKIPAARSLGNARPARVSTESRPVSPFAQAMVPPDATRGRRAQDESDYQPPLPTTAKPRRSVAEPEPADSSQHSAHPSDPAGPAWLYAPPASPVQRPIAPPRVAQSSVADTLQHSRERVAARWFALKGVFEQPGQELEAAPVRQKETRTPVLAVFSLAGGVGKTSLVATVGRSLSSMGEKVLLTDTTSHGLLPFYFGASELRHGTVRTFSPPSGSTDAPIYLVSYDVDQKVADDEAQELLTEEIISNSRGTHRILLDLTVCSSWLVRRLSRMNPTILVPVAPDMNSVISLQTIEKFFSGVNDGDGRPLQPYYVLNQFDASLPLHLDVREVMRRQLGDRLLPFVIRRAPAVSEALAEGMTVVDYAPDAPVAEDYLNLATWLRTVAAPATAGFRNVRWSER